MKNNKMQITDTSIIKAANSGGYLLQNWNKKCIDGNNNGKIQNFTKSTKTNSAKPDSGAASFFPVGVSFVYIETSGNNNGENVFCSFERKDIIQVTNITIYYISFSSSDVNLGAMGRLRIQLSLEDNTWSTRNNIAKIDRYSDTSTDWTLVILNFTVEKYGIKLIYDEIDTAHASMSLSNITTKYSVY